MKSASRIGMLLAIIVTCLAFLFVVIMNAKTETVVIGVIATFSSLMT